MIEKQRDNNLCLTEKDFDTLLKVSNSYFAATVQTLQNLESMPQIKSLFNELASQEDIEKTINKLIRDKKEEIAELDKVKSKLYALKELMLDQKGELSVEDIIGNDLKGKG